MSKLLQEYVKSVSQNVTVSIKKPIDLIISGGAFNGAYGLGSIMFLKELESQGKLKIERVSGSSVGALIALAYICDIDSIVEEAFIRMRDCLKKKGTLCEVETVIKEIVDKAFPDDDSVIKLNGILHITYTDLDTLKLIVVNKFSNKKILVKTLFRSAYLPLLTDGNSCENGRYVDGIIPHLFKDGLRDSLYISLVDYRTIFNTIITRSEVNPHYRIMQGAADTSAFFVEGKGKMCSLVSQWSIAKYGLHRIVFILCSIVALAIRYLTKMNTPISLSNQPLIKLIVNTINEILKDFLYAVSV
jgi:predicted acylesterase/phospholipase RssA